MGNLVNKSHSTVQYIINKFRYNGTTQGIAWRSKKRQLTEREERYVVNKIKTNPKLNVPKLKILVEQTTRKHMCNETIHRVLHKYGFHGHMYRKKPFVSRKNRAGR
ncbi:hypothetical protein C0J52_14806 [Blattella germanica]|nr:hypothetical protein C0J52_14806 [Blattella germanica]